VQKKSSTLDALDKRLLTLIQKDASLTHAQLAQLAFSSAPTVFRRMERFHQLGLIDKQITVLAPEKLGFGLTAIIELAMENQASDTLLRMEQCLKNEVAVQQVYRVSGGADFILVVNTPDMEAYHELVHRVFTAAQQVRNVRSFFSTHRSKFAPAVQLID
jgi:Lrp/AsnC family leucine-responsive transcriptional regulator